MPPLSGSQPSRKSTSAIVLLQRLTAAVGRGAGREGMPRFSRQEKEEPAMKIEQEKKLIPSSPSLPVGSSRRTNLGPLRQQAHCRCNELQGQE